MDANKRLDQIDARLEEIMNLLRGLQQASPGPAQSPGDVLSLDEAARYLGLAPRTLCNRKAGTASIPRYSDRPVLFLRGNLDQFKRSRVESKARRSQQPARTLKLIRRKKTA